MALDTRDKRAAAVGIAAPHRPLLPNPDGTVGQPDRQQVAFAYPGIEAGEPVPILIDNRTGTGAASRNATGTGAASRNATGTGRTNGASGTGRAPN